MKHLFVTYELAVKLKDIGFHELCFGKFLIPEIPENQFRFNTEGSPKDYNTGLYGRFISAPLYQQVLDWLREKHDVNIVVAKNTKEIIKFINEKDPSIDTTAKLYRWYFVDQDGGTTRPTYYEALNEAIEEALKLI